jgi:DNA-binding XRE family transcriptional regulator
MKNENCLNASSQISELRTKAKVSQEEASKAIGVSRPTWAKIESGQKELTVSQINSLAKLFHVCVPEIAKDLVLDNSGAESSPEMVEKYKQMITYMIFNGAESDGKIVKTKLAKLLYLSDFLNYFENQVPMSGMSYRKLPQGPVPNIYFQALDELENEGEIFCEYKGNARLYSLTEKCVPKNKLFDYEMQLMDRVCSAWKDRSTDEIVEFTHNQLPWQVCYDREVIPYGMITQEEPEMVYGPVLHL